MMAAVVLLNQAQQGNRLPMVILIAYIVAGSAIYACHGLRSGRKPLLPA
jgi:hypothetical protein